MPPLPSNLTDVPSPAQNIGSDFVVFSRLIKFIICEFYHGLSENGGLGWPVLRGLIFKDTCPYFIPNLLKRKHEEANSLIIHSPSAGPFPSGLSG